MPAKNLYQPKEKEKSIYSSSSTANSSHTAAARTQSAPQSNLWNAEQSTPSLQSNTLQKRGNREKSPSELGKEVVALMLREDALEARQPAASERATVQPLANARPEGNAVPPAANTGPGEHTSQSTRQSNLFTSLQRMFAEMTDHTYVAPAWQPPAAVQNPTAVAVDRGSQAMSDWQPTETAATQNLNSTAPNGSFSGGPVYTSRLPGELQQSWETTDPIQPAFDSAQPVFDSAQFTPKELMLAAVPDFATAGIDMNTVQAGIRIGDTFKQLREDTHLAPGTKLGEYLWDEIKSGAYTGAEGAWNGLVDLGQANANAWLQTQNVEMQQQALFNDAYREQAERNNMQTREALDNISEYAEGFRSHKAAEYAQYIDELYDAGGFFRIGGDIASGIGQMAPTIAVNVLTGGVGGMPYLYLSAAGNAAAEARAGGADDETALLYGMLSGSVEVLTEQLGDGIPGLDKGVMNKWLMGMAESNAGRAALKHMIGALGEGAEEFISEIAGAYLAQMWNGDERDFWQTLGETASDAFYAGFVGAMTSACMSVPGNLAETYNAYTVDTAMNAMKNGEILSGPQLANADKAMQKLIGPEDAESPWGTLPAQKWATAKSSYLNSFLPQMAGLNGNTADLGQNIPENLIPLPMFNNAAQNSQTNASETSLQANPAADSTAAAQNGQPDLSNLIMLPMFDHPAATQGNQTDSSNLIMLPMLNDAKPQTNAAVGDNSILSPGANSTMVQNGQTDISETAARTSPSQNAADLTTELTAEKAVGENTLQTDPAADTASPEIIAEQNAKIREQALEKGKAKGIELDTAEKLMNVTGLKLRYIYEEGSGVDGFISGDTVTVNLANDNSAFRVAAHEAGHSMKINNAKQFEAFQTSVQRIIESNAELKQYAEQIRAAYTAENSPALASLTNADGTLNTAALEEDVCLKTFERLIEDPERLVQAVAHDRSAIESFLDVLRGIKNSLVIKFTGSEKAMLDEAERTMVNLLRGEAGIVEDERFSYIGEKAKLKTRQLARLVSAKRMELEGKPDIGIITGWFRGTDGKWRWEIDDSKAQFYPNGDARGAVLGTRLTVRDFFVHPELEEMEPELFDMPVQIDPTLDPKISAAYLGLNDGIILSPSADKLSMLHELQHGIQDLEGFVNGSNRDWGGKWALVVAYEAAKGEPAFQALTTKEMRFESLQNKAMEIAKVNTFDDAAYKFYEMAAGEVEARDVEYRAQLDPHAKSITGPDMRGNVLYAENPNSRYIDLMKKIGYTK